MRRRWRRLVEEEQGGGGAGGGWLKRRWRRCEVWVEVKEVDGQLVNMIMRMKCRRQRLRMGE